MDGTINMILPGSSKMILPEQLISIVIFTTLLIIMVALPALHFDVEL